MHATICRFRSLTINQESLTWVSAFDEQATKR
jgi:hypothetical protein